MADKKIINSIEAMVRQSEFVPAPHLQFIIDGEPLDEILASIHPDRQLGGLFPTTLGWLENEIEQAEVWKRFSDLSVDRIVIPLLCCPDDLDFSCAVVIADTKIEADTVSWVQFGLDATPFHRLPDAIGSSADWLPGVGPFLFDRTSYETMIGIFTDNRFAC